MVDWLTYSNQNATRSQPISPDLARAMSFLPELGVTMNVYSGGQPPSGPNRVGSTRHDHGNAADVMFQMGGRTLDWNRQEDIPILSDIVARARAAGVTGIGAGNDYMGPGRVHIGFGPESVWGAGGRSVNAPEWLRSAFYGAPATARPASPALSAANAVTSAPPAVPQRPRGGIGGLVAGLIGTPPARPLGVLADATGISGIIGSPPTPQVQQAARQYINQGVRDFWSSPDLRPTVSQSSGYPVMTVSRDGGGISGLNFSSGSTSWGEDPVERGIRMANADAIERVTGSRAITQDAIDQTLSSGGTLVRRI